MKVENMINSRGNTIANQFVLSSGNDKTFQSYDSRIAVIKDYNTLKLIGSMWDYSVTTGTYRNQFLNETKKETQAKIDSGTYILTDLNG